MLSRISRRFTATLPRAHRFAIGSAWFFAIYSLLCLVWVIAIKGADPSGWTTLYQTSVASDEGLEIVRAFGLSYDGVPGLLLALVQAAVVGSALAFTVFGRGRWRWAGHGVLVAWAAMWMLDLMYLAGVDQQIGSIGQAALMTFLAASTVVRAFTPRSRRLAGVVASPATETPAPVAADAPEVEPVDVPRLERTPDRTDDDAGRTPASTPRWSRLLAKGRGGALELRNRVWRVVARRRADLRALRGQA